MQFLNPLSPIVWICTLGAFVVVSIVLYVLERIGSSSRSTAATPAAQRTPRITMREAFWFIFGSLLQGNTDSSPTTVPGQCFCRLRLHGLFNVDAFWRRGGRLSLIHI